MIELVFVELEPMTGRVLAVSAGTTIGRDGCDVLLADPDVSRRHAVIHDLASTPAIEDAGSTNGTFVNGHRIAGIQRLSAGDEVRLGNTVLTVQAPSAATRVGAQRAPHPA
jgi:pSer/pThr/pTyr-binding forkhead associated (FHA) protein